MSIETKSTNEVEQIKKQPSPQALVRHSDDVPGDMLAGTDNIGDLNDREKAWYCWQWIDEHRDVLAVRGTGKLYAYHDGIWQPDGEDELRDLANSLLGIEYGRNVLEELKDRVRAAGSVEQDTLGLKPGVLAVENGLLDLETRELRDLRPDDYALSRLPVEYDPSAECPRWIEFISEVAPVDRQDTLQEYIGYCLCVGEMRFKRALMLVGDRDAGKTTFLNTVRKLLGGENVPGVSLQELCNGRFAGSRLETALANIDADLSAEGLGDGSDFKKLVGNDVITVEEKYETSYEIHQTAKMLFAANQIPRFENDDLAFHERWLIVYFPETIAKEEQDRDLGEKLDEELSGILNWALEGRERLLAQDGFSNERPAREKRRKWRLWSDPLTEFIEQHLVEDSGNILAASTIHEAYSNFMRGKPGESYTQKKLTREINKRTLFNYGRYRCGGGERVRGYKDLKFVE